MFLIIYATKKIYVKDISIFYPMKLSDTLFFENETTKNCFKRKTRNSFANSESFIFHNFKGSMATYTSLTAINFSYYMLSSTNNLTIIYCYCKITN